MPRFSLLVRVQLLLPLQCNPPEQRRHHGCIKQFHVNSNTQNPGMKHCHEHAKPTDGDIFLNPEKPLQSRLAMNKEKMRELTSQTYVAQVIGTAVSQHHLLACTSRMRSIQMRFSPMPANRQWKTRASTSPTTLPQAFEIPTYNCFSPLCWDHRGLHRPGCTRYIRCSNYVSCSLDPASVRSPNTNGKMTSTLARTSGDPSTGLHTVIFSSPCQIFFQVNGYHQLYD
ncbi:uncharacterized protein [Paramisgurnus dabryanus]|uniref:uncharacterized protein isoform X3 n=1 Tax=Paramisgurnus dabryanus TaxID=90735 RepID=UPI0031F367F6